MVDDAKLIVVVFDCPKLAVPVGTMPLDHLAPLLKFPDAGADSHVAFCAAAGAAKAAAAARSPARAPRESARMTD